MAGLQSPVLASSLSPLDGVLVPTLGASYVAVTLLFPFVAIRVLGQEKEAGALRLLVQLPYRPPALIAAKLAAVFAAFLHSSIPAFSALVIWGMQGGHLSAPKTLNLLFGHLLYGLLVGAIALLRPCRKAQRLPRSLRSPSRSVHGCWISPWPANPDFSHGLPACR